MQKELIQILHIPQFSRKVKISEKQRPLYIKAKGRKRFPKECRNNNNTIAKDAQGYLLNANTKKRLLKNPNQAGKPKYHILNGNKFVYGFKNHYEKDIVVKKLKEYLLSEMTGKIKPFNYSPISINFYMLEYLPDRGSGWDVGNEWYWSKYMEDLLTETGKFPDDNIDHVIKSGGSPELNPVDNPNKRALVWKFYKVTDPEVLRYWPWTKFHNVNIKK